MGDPATPTEKDRAETLELAARIVESVRNDERMPLPDTHPAARAIGRDKVEQLVFQLAQEVVELRRERDSFRGIARSAAHLEAKAAGGLNDPRPLSVIALHAERDSLQSEVAQLKRDNERLIAAARRVPIARHTVDSMAGFTCLGCGSRSGLDVSTGRDLDESCAADCWVSALEAAMQGGNS